MGSQWPRRGHHKARLTIPVLLRLNVTFNWSSGSLGNNPGIEPPVACLSIIKAKEQAACHPSANQFFLPPHHASTKGKKNTHQLQSALVIYLLLNSRSNTFAHPSVTFVAFPPFITVPFRRLMSSPTGKAVPPSIVCGNSCAAVIPSWPAGTRSNVV